MGCELPFSWFSPSLRKQPFAGQFSPQPHNKNIACHFLALELQGRFHAHPIDCFRYFKIQFGSSGHVCSLLLFMSWKPDYQAELKCCLTQSKSSHIFCHARCHVVCSSIPYFVVQSIGIVPLSTQRQFFPQANLFIYLAH